MELSALVSAQDQDQEVTHHQVETQPQALDLVLDQDQEITQLLALARAQVLAQKVRLTNGGKIGGLIGTTPTHGTGTMDGTTGGLITHQAQDQAQVPVQVQLIVVEVLMEQVVETVLLEVAQIIPVEAVLAAQLVEVQVDNPTVAVEAVVATVMALLLEMELPQQEIQVQLEEAVQVMLQQLEMVLPQVMAMAQELQTLITAVHLPQVLDLEVDLQLETVILLLAVETDLEVVTLQVLVDQPQLEVVDQVIQLLLAQVQLTEKDQVTEVPQQVLVEHQLPELVQEMDKQVVVVMELLPDQAKVLVKVKLVEKQVLLPLEVKVLEIHQQVELVLLLEVEQVAVMLALMPTVELQPLLVEVAVDKPIQEQMELPQLTDKVQETVVPHKVETQLQPQETEVDQVQQTELVQLPQVQVKDQAKPHQTEEVFQLVAVAVDLLSFQETDKLLAQVKVQDKQLPVHHLQPQLDQDHQDQVVQEPTYQLVARLVAQDRLLAVLVKKLPQLPSYHS